MISSDISSVCHAGEREKFHLAIADAIKHVFPARIAPPTQKSAFAPLFFDTFTLFLYKTHQILFFLQSLFFFYADAKACAFSCTVQNGAEMFYFHLDNPRRRWYSFLS